MYMYWFINLLIGIVGIVACIYIVVRIHAVIQGDADFRFAVKKRTPLVMEYQDRTKAVFYTDIPYKNVGKQLGTIMDCFPRPQLPCELYDACRVHAWLTNSNRERTDGYWEAYIVDVGAKGYIRLRLEFMTDNGSIEQALATFPDMPVDIIYQGVSRSEWYLSKVRTTITGKEVRQALQGL